MISLRKAKSFAFLSKVALDEKVFVQSQVDSKDVYQ